MFSSFPFRTKDYTHPLTGGNIGRNMERLSHVPRLIHIVSPEAHRARSKVPTNGESVYSPSVIFSLPLAWGFAETDRLGTSCSAPCGFLQDDPRQAQCFAMDWGIDFGSNPLFCLFAPSPPASCQVPQIFGQSIIDRLLEICRLYRRFPSRRGTCQNPAMRGR